MRGPEAVEDGERDFGAVPDGAVEAVFGVSAFRFDGGGGASTLWNGEGCGCAVCGAGFGGFGSVTVCVTTLPTSRGAGG
jgi:hypothetical protein